jgi:endonuclease/exonuclease/phosphatase family metal-dependent hydrolase
VRFFFFSSSTLTDLSSSNSTQHISHALKMPYIDLGPGPHKNTWGAAVISKFPILRSTHHLLPSPSGELAPAIYATLDVYGVEVDVVVAHNGQEEDPVDRQLQSIELGRLMEESWPKPTLFLGSSFPLTVV